MQATTYKNNPDMSDDDSREIMAVILEGRHGVFAAEVADFMASVHGRLGDVKRCTVWSDVAEVVRTRESTRLSAQ